MFNLIKKIYPPVVAEIFISVFGVVGYFFGKIIYYPFNLIGIIVLILGFLIIISARRLFLKNKTGISPNSIVSEFIINGVYKYSRNPMYFGIFLIILGIGILIGSWISISASIVFVIVINITWISCEEKKMEKQFTKQYLEYKKNVRRWI